MGSRNSRGQSVLELVIVVTLLSALVIGYFDFAAVGGRLLDHARLSVDFGARP